ncbi:MAG: hypothetical protein ACRDYB_14390, partial [Acidimicrobiales bacterium]
MPDDPTPDGGGAGPDGSPDRPPGQGAGNPGAVAPTVVSRKDLRQQRPRHTWYYVLGGVAALLVAGVVALAATSGSSPS